MTTNIINIIKEIASYYLKDSKPFAVGYSGGKDSTVVLDLVFKALLSIPAEKRNKQVFVTFSDTRMEMDPVIAGINESFVAMQKFIDKHNLPVEIQRVEPVVEESFFSLLIGKGYKLPDTQNRWCTDRMKLRPQNRNIKKMEEDFEGVYAITGVRHAESADRSNRIKRNTINGMLKTHDNPNWFTLAPIENFSSDQIWSYIYTEALEWVDSNTLGRQYSEASGDGGECRTLLEGTDGEQAGCSKSARYGCWICPLFKKDKTLSNLTNHYDYMSKMEEFRNWLVSFKDMGWTTSRRVYKNSKQAKSIYNKNNHRKGMTVPSGYTLEWRKMVLERLWQLNLEVVQYRYEPLISKAELVEIQRLWFIEGDLDLSVEKIVGERLLEGFDKERAMAIYFKSKLFVEPEEGDIKWFRSYYKSIPFIQHAISDRYITQMAIELLERYSFNESISIFNNVLSMDYWDKDRNTAHKIITSLPVNKMYHPSEREEKYILKEWTEDKIGLMTFLNLLDSGDIKIPQKLLFGYDSEYSEHFEQLDELKSKKDITLCETISLEDKMAFFDTYYN